jgi:hypothetical protein
LEICIGIIFIVIPLVFFKVLFTLPLNVLKIFTEFLPLLAARLYVLKGIPAISEEINRYDSFLVRWFLHLVKFIFSAALYVLAFFGRALTSPYLATHRAYAEGSPYYLGPVLAICSLATTLIVYAFILPWILKLVLIIALPSVITQIPSFFVLVGKITLAIFRASGLVEPALVGISMIAGLMFSFGGLLEKAFLVRTKEILKPKHDEGTVKHGAGYVSPVDDNSGRNAHRKSIPPIPLTIPVAPAQMQTEQIPSVETTPTPSPIPSPVPLPRQIMLNIQGRKVEDEVDATELLHTEPLINLHRTESLHEDTPPVLDSKEGSWWNSSLPLIASFGKQNNYVKPLCADGSVVYCPGDPGSHLVYEISNQPAQAAPTPPPADTGWTPPIPAALSLSGNK